MFLIGLAVRGRGDPENPEKKKTFYVQRNQRTFSNPFKTVKVFKNLSRPKESNKVLQQLTFVHYKSFSFGLCAFGTQPVSLQMILLTSDNIEKYFEKKNFFASYI